MRIEKLAEPGNGLDKYVPPGDWDPESDIARAADLFYGLLNGSFQCSENCLDIEINGHRENVQGIYWKCKDLMDQIGRHGEKAGFLAMSAIEQCWQWAKPLVLCRLEDLLAPGGTAPLENARELDRILSDNPYKKLWAEKSALYVSILERIGFDPGDADFSDLTKIMDPLLDALSFYKTKDGKPIGAYRARSGPRSGSGSPAIARAMCMFDSEKAIVDAAMSAGPEALVMFAGLEQTNAQIKDYFYEWFYGYPDERQRNFMRNERATEEEYLAAPADYTRTVYLCVKDGGTVWLLPMPFKGDMYRRVGQEGSDYYYGKRASYAPYQIFFKKDLKGAPEGTTMLAVKKTGYLLNELLDSLSMAWFPAFMDETIRHFFKDGNGVVPKDVLFPEETAARTPGSQEYAVVPVHSGVPALCSWTYAIREPAEMFEEPFMAELFGYFDVSSKDLAGAPILPTRTGNAASYRSYADGKARSAYLKLLGIKIAAFMDGRWAARNWMLAKISARTRDIITDAGNGDCMAFMEAVIDGTPILDENGKQKTVTSSRYPYNTSPAVQRTEMSDARDEVRSRTLGDRVLWASDPTSGKPPVVWKLRPTRPEHYAALAGCGIEDLPELLRMSGLIRDFNEAYADRLPKDLGNEYVARGYGAREAKSTRFPCLCPVNVCMTKKAHGSFPYFRAEKKKKKK